MGRSALVEFIRTNQGKMISYVRSKLSDTARRDSEDIVQDVMLSLLEGHAVTEPIINLSAYVFRALRNRIVDEYRKPKNTTASLDKQDDNETSLYDILPDMKYEPESSFAREKLREEIYQAINELPHNQQTVIMETEFKGTTMKELQERTDVPLGTLLARKHRGLKTIQKKLYHIKEEYYGTGEGLQPGDTRQPHGKSS